MTSRSISGTATTATSSPIFRTRTSTTATTVASAPRPAALVATVSIITSTVSVAASIITVVVPTSFVPIISSVVRITAASSSIMRESWIVHSRGMLTLHHLHLTIAKSLILVHLVSTIPLILSFPTHITIQDSHEVATKVTNFSPWHGVDFINSI